MRVAPCCVHEKEALVIADRLRVALRPLIKKHLTPSTLRCRRFDRLRGRVRRGGRRLDRLCRHQVNLERIGTELDGVAVDGEVRHVTDELLDASDLELVALVLRGEVPGGRGDREELRVLIDEGRRHDPGLERRVGEHVEQEGDVRLDAANARLLEGSAHTEERLLERRAARGVLDEERVVVRRDRHARVADTVLAHAEAGRVAVHRDRAGVGREVALGVLGRDAALDGDATRRDVLLNESKGREGGCVSEGGGGGGFVGGAVGCCCCRGECGAGCVTWMRPMSSSDSPEAMRSWVCTTSMPVTSSVTVCST